MNQGDDPQSQDPVVYDNGVTYMFIQHNNVYLMTATRQNCNAASLLLFLHRVVDVSDFFGNEFISFAFFELFFYFYLFIFLVNHVMNLVFRN